MKTRPVDVTILPAPPEAGWVLAYATDIFEDEAVCNVMALGPLVAWRYDTWQTNDGLATERHPIGAVDAPTDEDWVIEAHSDHGDYLDALATYNRLTAEYDTRHDTTTEENLT